MGVNEKIIKVPLASSKDELASGYADSNSRTYYKRIGSKKIASFPYPLTSSESSLPYPLIT